MNSEATIETAGAGLIATVRYDGPTRDYYGHDISIEGFVDGWHVVVDGLTREVVDSYHIARDAEGLVKVIED